MPSRSLLLLSRSQTRVVVLVVVISTTVLYLIHIANSETLSLSLSLLHSLPTGHDHAYIIPVQQNALQLFLRLFPTLRVSIVLDRVFQHAVHVHVETFQYPRELFVSALHDDPNFLVDAFVHQLGR